MLKNDFAFLQRCLHLAQLSEGTHYPNPQVGALIVHDGHIIGEGYHHTYGGPHAEVAAVRAVADKSLLATSTIYVSLEPCNHTGKTPPCVDLILTHKIPRVVIGCLDPNPLVAGKGAARLRDHGIEVIINPEPQPFESLIAWFRVNQLEKRSWITAKWAESLDGFVGKYDANGNPTPTQLTGFEAGTFTHQLRAKHQAILIGRGTAQSDDPSLTTRYFPGRSPLRLVLDPRNQLSSSLRLFTNTKTTKRLTRKPVHDFDWQLPDKQDWNSILTWLYLEKKVCSIFVEGGTNTLQRLLDVQRIDQLIRYKSPVKLGNGVPTPVLDPKIQVFRHFFAGKDQIEFLNWG